MDINETIQTHMSINLAVLYAAAHIRPLVIISAYAKLRA